MSRMFPILVFLLLAFGGGLLYVIDSLGATSDVAYELPKILQQRTIAVDKPRKDQLVESPITIQGRARGNWYFEATFPIKLKDADGFVIAQGNAEAQGEWTTDNYVPFNLVLSFKTPNTDTGTLVFEKDNPSGDPKKAESYSVPIKFK